VEEIKMVDLNGQYIKIKSEIDSEIQNIINNSSFINGPSVTDFRLSLQKYLKVKHVIPCANGTDAIQIALMALNIKKGSEVIVPSFSFAAPAEVVSLLGYIPVFADVNEGTFNLSAQHLERVITERTGAIIPVHLFGQCADMSAILEIAKKYNIPVIEDNAQSLGAIYKFNNEETAAGTMGNIGITSFFPSKNLGCMGDGGAIFTNDNLLAEKALMISNHGQKIKYQHEIIGINSRLDSIQASILKVKLKYLESYNNSRRSVAGFYNNHFSAIQEISIPALQPQSSHVYNQYTVKVSPHMRNYMVEFLKSKGIPTMVYYPKPLHLQNAFKYLTYQKGDLPVSEKLCSCVLSLPIHTEITENQLQYICTNVEAGIRKYKTKNVVY
jgi:UDP-2-acetamido-2-deoxy-ribo-hexuluronate aminotransferase